MNCLKDLLWRVWAAVLRILSAEDEFPASARPKRGFGDHLH